MPEIHSKYHWIESVAHLSQFNQQDIPQTQDEFQKLLHNETNPDKRAALHTGIARCYIRAGNFIKGSEVLSYAHSLLTETDHEAKAFVLLEMSEFLSMTGSYDMALSMATEAQRLVKSEYMKQSTKYAIALQVTRRGEYDRVTELLEVAEYFEDIGQFSTLASILKNVANTYQRAKDYDSAVKFYKKAKSIAKEHDYQFILADISHDVGMLELVKGNFEKAMELLKETVKTGDSFYQKGLALGNIGYVYFNRADWEKATTYFQQSLNLCAAQGVFTLVSDNCYFLGQCYEKLGKTALAKHFYGEGYRAVMELHKKRIPILGNRQKTVEAYVEFLNKHHPAPYSDEQTYDFSFALEKTLVQIRSTFQGALLDFALGQTTSVKKALKTLEMAESTYFRVRRRIAEHKIEPTPEAIKEFIQKNVDSNWKKINAVFEAEILGFLHKKYGNKKRMSEKLEISYPQTVKLTNKRQVSRVEG